MIAQQSLKLVSSHPKLDKIFQIDSSKVSIQTDQVCFYIFHGSQEMIKIVSYYNYRQSCLLVSELNIPINSDQKKEKGKRKERKRKRQKEEREQFLFASNHTFLKSDVNLPANFMQLVMLFILPELKNKIFRQKFH